LISDRLRAVILRELSLQDFPLSASTVASEVPGWDSLSHVRVLMAVEKEYGIRFRSHEVIRLKSVGGLQALVDKRIGVAGDGDGKQA
jgi:acyl carrier protein